MNYWFTSDWHLSHYNLMIKLNRPFKTIDEMNSTIIDNFYSQIKAGDQVYFLGDFSWDKKVAFDFFSKLPKNIHFHFIFGNHDKKIITKDFYKYFNSYSWLKDININKQKITLCHYMMLSWNCSHWNAWQLFGHHHGSQQTEKSIGKTLNVCVDLNNFKMWNYDEIAVHMNKRPDNWDLIK